VFKPGDDVFVLPSAFTSTIAAIHTFTGPVEKAFVPMSVIVGCPTTRTFPAATSSPAPPTSPPPARA
jgi:hypothetical protein